MDSAWANGSVVVSEGLNLRSSHGNGMSVFDRTHNAEVAFDHCHPLLFQGRPVAFATGRPGEPPLDTGI